MAVPAVAVAALYGPSMAGGFVFGNLVFGVRAVAMASWLVPVGGGPTTSAARKTGAQLPQADRKYAREVSRGTDARLPVPARAAFLLTGTTVLGWVLLLVVVRAGVDRMGFLPGPV